MFSVNDSFWAHKRDDKTPETLNEHTNLTKIYLEKIKKAKNLDIVINDLIVKILKDKNALKFKCLMLEIFDNLIIWHDIGKINPTFQAMKMKNKAYKRDRRVASTHSDKSFKEIKKSYEEEVFKTHNDTVIFLFYHLLSNVLNHHSTLKDGLNYDILGESILDVSFRNIDREGSQQSKEIYLLVKLHYSLLIACDFYATSEYMNDIETTDFGIFSTDEKERFFNKFKTFYNSLSKDKEIDILRNEIFKSSEQTLLENLNKNIFYLEAPTGSGKTLTSLNLALNLLNNNENLNKIFYIFPFNTLISQTYEIFKNIFKDDEKIAVINSITPPVSKNTDDTYQENDESKYEKTYINRTFFNHPFILTSHVRLFETLFGVSKENNYPLFCLANSIVIIDEIQSYDPNLWEFMAFFLDEFAKFYNIKFIIMSATLPKISNLINSQNEWVELLKNREAVFSNPLFKDRVSPDFSLLEIKKDKIFNELINRAKEKETDKILFEFITKKSAREFYNFILDKFNGYDIFELSGDDNKLYRKKVIAATKEDKKCIVVATQIIEAGVDIDMDLGFKDIATIESEEQFLGRINRNSLKRAKVYFFDYDDANKVYRDDERMKFNTKDKNLRKSLINKNFTPYYNTLLNELFSKNSKAENSLVSKRDEFFNEISALNFMQISNKMKLIKDNSEKIFLPFSIDIKKFDMSEYGDISELLDDENKLSGQKVWEAVKNINEVKSYSKRKIKAISLNALAEIFSFNVYNKFLPSLQYGYHFIDDFENLVDENGKFLRENFDNKFKNESMFL